MEAKVGQLNFACVDCHERAAGRWIRGQHLGGSRGQIPHFPTWRTSRGEVWDIRKRFQWCNVQARADELPPDAREYGDLELYLASLSNGLPVAAPGIRH
jgi:L-cysteine S-thiosulfotransferase